MKNDTENTKYDEISAGIEDSQIIVNDENEVPQRKRNDEYFIKMYVYVRRCIRDMELISIFMGTNAIMTNFINKDQAISSRGEINEDKIDIPWCFVIHKLTAVDKEIIEELKKETIKSINEEKEKEKISRFIEIISESIVNERPLFVKFIFETIKQSIENKVYEVREIIENITKNIYEEYMGRKKMTQGFMVEEDFISHNFSNLTLLTPEFWRENLNEESRDRDMRLEKTQGINNHIASLYVPEEVRNIMKENEEEMNYFGVTINMTQLDFSGTKFRDDRGFIGSIEFQREQTFNSFKNETFGQLSFIGKSNYNKIFLQRVINKNIKMGRKSTFNAGNEIYEKYKVETIDKSNRWNLFEISMTISGLIASHSNGLLGSKFEDWLSNFIREINSNKRYNEKLPKIKFPERDVYWDKNKNRIIPMCGSSVSSPWNEKLGRYLKEECKYNIGTIYGCLGKESRDFYIEEYGTKEIQLIGECKHYEKGVGVSEIKEIINKMKEYKAGINLIIVKQISCRIDKIKREIENTWLYILEDNQNEYEIKEICKSKNEEDIGFLIINHSIINRYYENDINS